MRCWGMNADVLYPPHGADPEGGQRPLPGFRPGFALIVSRLLAYKRVDVVVEAMRSLTGVQLAIVGDGPEATRLRAIAPPNCQFLGPVDDDALRWLYGNAGVLVSAAHDDFGLVPLEAMA